MNAWDKLSMAEKAEMIGVAVRQGYTHLPEIREKYNEFAKGGNIYDGESQSSNQIITTGGTGHIPDNYGQGTMDAVRRRLYRNITPFGYHNPISRTFNAVVRNIPDEERASENRRIIDSVPEASALDAIWATYLNIPENQRRNINSKYGISKTKDGYYRFNRPGMIFNFEQDLSPHGLFGLPGRKAVMMNGILGNYTTGLGRDTKGDYIFYSDSRLNPDGTPNIKTGWDINPYSNTVDKDTEETTEEHGQYGQDKKDLSYRVGKTLFGNVEDVSMGVGTPVPIYDKIYLDDYYNVPEKERGGYYLPEITVTGKKKKALGGPLVEAAMAHYYDGETEKSQQMNLPWQGDWMTDEDAQKVEDIRHPQGHFLDTITVTAPYISDSHRMKTNLQENISRAKEKNAKDAYTLQRNMNQVQDDFARNFGLNLYGLMGGSPLVNLGIEGLALTAPEVGGAIAGGTGRRIGNYIAMMAPLAPLTVRGIKVGSKPVIDAAKEVYDNGTLWDAQTTFKGRLGNYSDNLFTNVYATAARRFGLPDKARIPADAMRKLSTRPNVNEDGLINFTSTRESFGDNHINASLDRPVLSHSKGIWDKNDLFIFPTRNFIEQAGNNLKSIEPSDMFSHGSRYLEFPENVTVVSGDTDLLNWARSQGMQTLSSPKLRRLYQKIPSDYQLEIDRYNALTPYEKGFTKIRRNAKHQSLYPEYSTEVQRLQSQRGTPTLADFQLLEKQTGLNSGVVPVSEYSNAVNSLRKMENTFVDEILSGAIVPYKYPNGRVVDWSNASREYEYLTKNRYNNVFYDPTSNVENRLGF